MKRPEIEEIMLHCDRLLSVSPRVARKLCDYASTLESQLKAEQTSVNKLSLHCQELEAVLHRIFNFGHNNDCIFCGFKDKEALKGLGKEVKP